MKNKLTCFILLCSFFAVSQRYYDDAQFRGSIYLEKKLNKRFFLSLKQQNRLTYNFTDYNRGSLDLGVSWRVFDFMKLQADAVYIKKHQKEGGYATRYRYYVAAVFKVDVKRFKFLYRNMFQVRQKEANTSKDAYILKLYDRSKLTVKYEVNKRMNVYAAEEIYFPLNNPQIKGPDRSRTILGTDFKTFRNQEVDIYVMYQFQLRNQDNSWYEQKTAYPNPLLNRDYIYGITYSFLF